MGSQYESEKVGKISEQNWLKELQMVQFECPRYWIPCVSLRLGEFHFPFFLGNKEIGLWGMKVFFFEFSLLLISCVLYLANLFTMFFLCFAAKVNFHNHNVRSYPTYYLANKNRTCLISYLAHENKNLQLLPSHTPTDAFRSTPDASPVTWWGAGAGRVPS